MLREECIPHQENIPAYSLGALDVEEISVLESHLVTCEDCQAELAQYQQISHGLMRAVPVQFPASNLRDRLAEQLPSHHKRTSSLRTRFTSSYRPGAFVNAAVMLALLVMNIFSFIQIRSLQEQQASLAARLSSEQEAVALLAYPNTQVRVVKADLQNLTGSLLIDENGTSAVLFLWNLPDLGNGEIYQAWLIDANGKRSNGGLFIPASGQNYTTFFVNSSVPLTNFVGIGVTIEPMGGSEQPTGTRILSVSL